MRRGEEDIRIRKNKKLLDIFLFFALGKIEGFKPAHVLTPI